MLLHELAHVRRGDVAMHLLARTALALYWWNPLAWFAWREFLKERERATDDLVLHAGARASDYAGHLLEVARTLQPAPATAWAAIAMARRSQFEGRLIAILDSGVDRKPSGRRAPVAAAAARRRADRAVCSDAGAGPRDSARSRRHHPRREFAEESRASRPRRRGIREALPITTSRRSCSKTRSPSANKSADAGSAAYAAGLVKLGDLAARRRQTAEAVAFYSKAVSFGDRPEVVPRAALPRDRAPSTLPTRPPRRATSSAS